MPPKGKEAKGGGKDAKAGGKDAKAGGKDAKGGDKAGDKGGKGGKDKGGKGGKGGKEEKKDEKKGDAKDAKGGEKGKGGKDKGGKGGGKDEKKGEGKDEKKDEKKEEATVDEDEDSGKKFDPLPEEQDEELLRKLGLLGKSKKRVRKEAYAEKLKQLLNEYKNVLICSVDNVGSNQMQKVRLALRGSAVLLMGKNTVMRKIIRAEGEKNAKLLALLDVIVGNVGFVFTNGDLNDSRGVIQSNKVPAAAKSGTLAPTDVIVPPGPTGLDPGQTGFFQALQIQTKIVRGSIEIITPVNLIKAGEKITSSHVALLSKLNIRPFHYGIKVIHAYEDGAVYEAKLLDLSHDDLLQKFFKGVRQVAALSLALHQPTLASLPHIFANATKNLIAISLATDYTFKESKAFKDYLENPDAFKTESKKEDVADKDVEAAEPEKDGEDEEEKDEESDGAIGGGLFGGDDD